MIEAPVQPGSWEREIEVERALDALRDGVPVIVVDDEACVATGFLVIAAGAMTDSWFSQFLRHTTGVVRVITAAGHLHRLGITTRDASVALRDAPAPGAASARAATIRALASCPYPETFIRPGQVSVLEATRGGVLSRSEPIEAAVDLVRLAGLAPITALCEISGCDRGELATTAEVDSLAGRLGIPALSVTDVVRHRLEHDSLIERVTETRLPTRTGTFRCIAYRTRVDDREHLALVMGEPSGVQPALVRVQRSFALNDLLVTGGTADRSQLEVAMSRIAREGCGVVVYLRPYTDIGAGIVHELQDHAHRFEAAASRPYLGYDERQHGIGAQILRDLGLRQIRLLSDHPGRHRRLAGFGLDVVEYVRLTDPPARPEDGHGC